MRVRRKGYTGEDAAAKIQREVVADLVGDYLFTDKAFVQKLSTENRNVFQKIFDEIKYLCKVATAGSKEARQLLEVKKIFEEAYRAETKNPTGDGGVRYSLTEKVTPSYEELVAKEPVQIVNVKGGIESGSYADMKDAAVNKAKSEGWFDKPHHNDDTDGLIFLTEKSFSHAYSNLRSDFGEDTIRCMAHIPEIIQNAVLVSVDAPRDPTKQETKVYTFLGAIEGVSGIEPVKLTVKEYDFSILEAVPKNIRSYFEKNGVMESYDSLYDAHALEVIGIESAKKESDASGRVYEQSSEAQATSDSKINVADLLSLVKGDAQKYIPSRSKSAVDQAYTDAVNRGDMDMAQKMVDQAARDAGAKTLPNGRLISYYHGTNKSFTSFDAEKARLGNHGFGFYVTPVKDFASGYGEPMKTYLMTDNLATSKDHRITEEQVNAVVDRFGLNLADTVYSEYSSITEWMSGQGDSTILQNLQDYIVRETGYKAPDILPFFQKTFGYDGLRVNRETVLWDNRLLKSADPVTYDDNGDVIPLSERFNTENNDIRYSLSEQNQAETDSPFPLPWQIKGEDVGLFPMPEDIARLEAQKQGAETVEPLENALADGAGIRGQLRNSQDKLDVMQPVAEIQVPAEYAQMDIATKKNWVVEKLRHTGYKVERKGLGIIDFAKKRLKSAFNYFDKNSAEEVAFEAIPSVLESGVEIANRGDHKDRNYGTVTIAAPITINGKRGNMAVVVKRTDGNYYKVHRILTPDGSVFNLPEMTNEAESTPAGELPKNGSLATPKDPASMISIPENRNVVNPDASTGAAPSGFDPVSHLQYEYGSLPEGENAVREDSLPKSTTGKDKVSLTARTAKGAEATPDELVDLLDKETVGGRFSYIPIKNSATVKAAYQDIAEKGWEAAKGEWQAKYDSKKNKDTKYANNLLRRIENLKRRKASIDADYAKRINDIKGRAAKKIIAVL